MTTRVTALIGPGRLSSCPTGPHAHVPTGQPQYVTAKLPPYGRSSHDSHRRHASLSPRRTGRTVESHSPYRRPDSAHRTSVARSVAAFRTASSYWSQPLQYAVFSSHAHGPVRAGCVTVYLRRRPGRRTT